MVDDPLVKIYNPGGFKSYFIRSTTAFNYYCISFQWTEVTTVPCMEGMIRQVSWATHQFKGAKSCIVEILGPVKSS
jgi:hypothetical protein